ncbi:MAG TPA: alginate lyase family protein [Prolixibacteraceae bacterium]|nr:alginate lyase family protein [Prolixibacteraceae bacterium]
MKKVKKEVKDTKSSIHPAFEKLITDAESALTSGPFSVTYKNSVSPGGTKHDYMSRGPYWWPDSTKPGGIPYIRRDGVHNPEAGIDRNQFGGLVSSTRSLALAWYFTGEKKYAVKAADLLRIWFLDTATLMNPHLEYAQSIPGITKGRGIGIIDFRGMYTLVDVISLLKCSGLMNQSELDGIEKWFSDFFTWLTTSSNGKDEDNARNNHSVAYDVIVTSIARFLGNDEYVVRKISEIPFRRIDPMIEADGRQPEELARTNGWGYSVMNLNQFFDAGEIGLKSGLNIFEYKNPEGGSLKGALDFLIGFIGNKEEWKWQQIGVGWTGKQARTDGQECFRILP